MLALALAGAAALPASAGRGPATSRAAASADDAFSRRVIKVFDFDEKSRGNLEEVPMNWEKVTLSGFPHYVNGQFDYAVGDPAPSFRLQLNGGNLGYVYSERLIPAFPGSDHKIIARVKTRKLVHARGYLKAFYIDRFGNFLPDTIVYSNLIDPPRAGDPEWRSVSVELPFTNPDGRFVGLGLFLVQQDQLPSVYSSPLKSFRKDIDATMWVDQIAILRLPKVRLNLTKCTTLYHSNEELLVGATVADAKTDDLSARILLYDLAADRLKALRHPVAVLPPLEQVLTGQAADPRLIVQNLGRQAPGLYRLSLQVLSAGHNILEKGVSIAVLAKERPPTQFEDLGLDLSDAPLPRPDLAAEFAGQLKPAWVVLPLWRQDLPVSRIQSDPSPADRMIVEINHRGIPILGAFLDVPEGMGARTNVLNPNLWDLLAGKPEWWRPELSIALSRHADRIDQWVFGRISDCWHAPDSRIEPVLNRLKQEFGQFQGQFTLLPNWPAMIAGGKGPPADGCFLNVPAELVPGSFEDFFKPWTAVGDRLWAALAGQDLAKVQMQAALTDFVQRFVQAKAARAPHLAARNLWTIGNPIAPDGHEPNAYYVVYANLIDRLGGLEYLGKIQYAPERYGTLFSSSDRAVLVLADPHAEDYRGLVSLGDQLQAYDLWGRELPVRIDADGWQVPYRPIVFLDAIDGDLARWVASVHFQPPSLPSRFGAHQVQLVFTNTFSQSLGGSIHVQGPPFWQFDPSGARFVLTTGKDFVLPMKLRYPTSESVGRKSLAVKFELETRKPIKLSLVLPLVLGGGDLDMRVLWFLRGPDLVVWQEVANNGREWVDLTAFVIAPDQPRLERPIHRLGPGQTAVKEYDLGPRQTMLGQTIRVGFRETRGTRLVNEVITLE